MAGFGVSKMGHAPFGVGSPPEPPAKPTGKAGSRYLNPSSKDYQIDASTGQFAQMPGTRQRVLLAVTTDKDSSGVEGFGMRRPKRMGTHFEAEMRAFVQEALRHMIEVEKSLRLDAVIVERGLGGRSRTTIVFKDLVTGDTDSVAI